MKLWWPEVALSPMMEWVKASLHFPKECYIVLSLAGSAAKLRISPLKFPALSHSAVLCLGLFEAKQCLCACKELSCCQELVRTDR